MYITNIRVTYHGTMPKDKKEAIERAMASHKLKCPAAASVERGIRVSVAADFTEEK